MNVLSLFDNAENLEHKEAGSVIFRSGDPGDSMYVVIEGEVTIRSDAGSFGPLGRGELFGEMSLIDDMPRSADAVAETYCVLAPVDERPVLYLVHEVPMFALHVMGVMAERLRNQS